MPLSHQPRKRRNRSHPAAGAPPKRSTFRLNWRATWRAHKDFFDAYDFASHNARHLAGGRKKRIIGSRRAMLRTTARELMYQVMTNHPERHSGRRLLWFPLLTKKGSIGTCIDRTGRSVDTYLQDLLAMGLVREQERQAHGIRLVLDPALFVFEDAAGKHAPPIPAAEEPADQPPLSDADIPLLTAELRAQMLAAARQKIAENTGCRPLQT